MKEALHLINDLHTDFKAVAIAAELIERGEFQSDQIAVLPMGPKKRAYSKEIAGHTYYYSDSKRKDCLNLETHQEGMYDMLPEGLFHNPPTGSSGMSEDQMVADVQFRRNEEKDARKFFMPFEAELNHLRTTLELYENRLDKKTTYDDLTQIFAAEWKEFELFDKEQSVIWMHLLPMIHQKRNDVDFMGELLCVLFKIPIKVTVRESHIKPEAINESIQFRLGYGSLGINSIIGATFETDDEEMVIHIGPVNARTLSGFMPGTQSAAIIDLVVSYLVPVGTDVKIELTASDSNQVGVLGAENNNSYLGFTTYL